MAFTVLHSSDWHLGKRLYHKSRESEFRQFLDWLCQQLDPIDLLLIAGDVFDTNSPPVWAQELYYQFLHRASQHCEIIVCAGNHDSALFLEAPKSLLKALRVHVVGNPSELLQAKVQSYCAEPGNNNHAPGADSAYPTELIPIYTDGKLQTVVCTLPYLRDSYLRSSNWGETPEDKERQLQQGTANYYQVICDEAQRYLRQHGPPNAADTADALPIIAMGHLFATGASTVENDGVRELYIGSLGHFSAQHFPKRFDYVALGHVHQMQRLHSLQAGQELRYSGSPIAFSFGELKSQKQLLQLTFAGRKANVEAIDIPQWQELYQLQGDAAALEQGLQQLIERRPDPTAKPWLELEYIGGLLEGQGLREKLHELAEQHGMEILRYRNTAALHNLNSLSSASSPQPAQISLRELSPEEVFERLLQQRGLAGPQEEQAEDQVKEEMQLQQQKLWKLYRGLLHDIDLQVEKQVEGTETPRSESATEGREAER